MKWVDERENVHGAPVDSEAFWKTYTSWVRFKDLDIDPKRCRELVEMQGDQSFENIFRAVLIAYSERTGKERVGEKSPSHVHYLPHLLEWFPDAQVLIMQRDPRAVVASQLRTAYVQERLTPPSLREGVFVGSRLHKIAYYARDWATIYEDVVPRWEGDPRVRIVSYEKLTRNPQEEVRSICDFLGEAYEVQMITRRTRATVPMPAGKTPNERLEKWRRKHHEKSLRPITPDSIDKWKKELSQNEVAIVEGTCIRGMRAARYTPTLSSGQRVLGHATANSLLSAEKGEKRIRWLTGAIRGRVTKIINRNGPMQPKKS